MWAGQVMLAGDLIEQAHIVSGAIGALCRLGSSAALEYFVMPDQESSGALPDAHCSVDSALLAGF